MRIRPNTNHDTPVPPEVPAGENPPPGAIFYYYLKSAVQGEARLEILDSAAHVVRSYSSNDKPWTPPFPPPFPNYWLRPAPPLSAQPGMHRLIWDLHYTQPSLASPLRQDR